METQMVAQGMATAYTTARAVSPGMNITFAKRGCQYNGRLINEYEQILEECRHNHYNAKRLLDSPP